jgi:uncharacterized protein
MTSDLSVTNNDPRLWFGVIRHCHCYVSSHQDCAMITVRLWEASVMNGSNSRWKCSALASVLCLITATASAAEIRDDAKLFGPDVVAAQQTRLDRIERSAHHGVTIETYSTLPQGRAEDVEAMSSRERAQFYSDWLKQRAKAARAEGIFVLITKEPGHVEVGVSSKLQSAGYSHTSKKRLVDTFLAAFRAKEFDRGLTDAVSLIEKDYAQLKATGVATRSSPNAPAQAPRAFPVEPGQPAQRISWWSIGLVVAAVVIGLMILSSIMRAFAGGSGQYGSAGYGGGYGNPAGGYGGGGGGLGRGLMGGLLGGMAGSWLYDSFGRHSGSAHAGEPPTSGGDWNQPSASDDSWSTSGGDFGGGGGGDFGGGDFGGGDSGGDF